MYFKILFQDIRDNSFTINWKMESPIIIITITIEREVVERKSFTYPFMDSYVGQKSKNHVRNVLLGEWYKTATKLGQQK